MEGFHWSVRGMPLLAKDWHFIVTGGNALSEVAKIYEQEMPAEVVRKSSKWIYCSNSPTVGILERHASHIQTAWSLRDICTITINSIIRFTLYYKKFKTFVNIFLLSEVEISSFFILIYSKYKYLFKNKYTFLKYSYFLQHLCVFNNTLILLFVLFWDIF